MVEVVMQARNETIGKLIQECAEGRLQFSGPGSLCEKVAAMGFKTTSLYEMVRAAEYQLWNGVTHSAAHRNGD
jgi:hypothetical protein